MSIKLPKKPQLEYKGITGVKVLVDEHELLEKYKQAYEESYSQTISLGELVGLLAVAYVNGDTNFKRNS